jgi:chromate transport protein ChrA
MSWFKAHLNVTWFISLALLALSLLAHSFVVIVIAGIVYWLIFAWIWHQPGDSFFMKRKKSAKPTP